jgi:hypothetical protein
VAVGNLNMTDVSVQQKETSCGMAHFAGTGPNGKTCKECRYLQSRDLTKSDLFGRIVYHCRKFKEMTKKNVELETSNLLSCKYFEEK